MIRALELEDIDKLKEIHEKFYKDEFPFPNFLDKFLGVFSVVEDNELICTGGLKLITEAVLITDKGKSVRVRRYALNQIFQAMLFTAGRTGYDQIHTTVIEDTHWEKHLFDIGFHPVRGTVLVKEV